MKISNIKEGVVGTGQVGSSGAAQQAREASNEASAVKKSGVTLSSTGEKIASAFSGDAAKRADRVAGLKLEVSSGAYRPDSGKTAAGIMKDVTGYSLA